MAVGSLKKTVTTTATRLDWDESDRDSGGALMGGKSLIVRNEDSLTIYWGDSSVTAAQGQPLKPAEALSIDLDAGETLYAITESGTASDIRVSQNKA